MSEKIVLLDKATIDYGDIDFSKITGLGEFTSFDITLPEETEQRISGATIVITNKVVLDAEILSKATSLKLIVVAATGYNNIDTQAAAKLNIRVTNVSGYSTYSTAQLTMTFILALTTQLAKYNEAAHNGTWSRSPVFTLGSWPIAELQGKTIGILGFGAIGSQVAKFCDCFGMNVIALQRDDVPYVDSIPRFKLLEIAHRADFISIHMPLTSFSRNIISQEVLGQMKSSAFVINMARGGIVDVSALIWALEKGVIAGAALDVTDKEPISADDPLLKAPNLLLTPHIAWASKESRVKLVSEIFKNIEAFLKGEKRNVIESQIHYV